jgi:hypothetical protein
VHVGTASKEEDAVRDALSKALVAATTDASVDRVLANAFYRTRPMQAGTVATVVNLSERRQSFLAAGPQGHGGTRR